MAKQNNQPVKPSRSAREEAASARAASMEKARKRQRTINIAIAAVIAVVVIAIVGGALVMSNQAKKDNGTVVNPDAAVPSGVFTADQALPFGVPYGTNPEAPVVEIWEDMQCPACAAFESVAGENLKAKADAGEILLVSRPTTFLDRSFATDHSRRATAAYGCAIDGGKGLEYKTTVLANQPATEGDGWTDEQLVGFAGQVGIEGAALTAFETCFTDRTYLPWAANSTEAFYAAGVGGTPSILVEGKSVSTADAIDPEKFQKLIDEAAAEK